MPDIDNAFRLRLVLGKFQVKSVTAGHLGRKFAIDIGNSVTLTVDCPIRADVKVGDLLTLYTEVLADVQPNSAPIQ